MKDHDPLYILIQKTIAFLESLLQPVKRPDRPLPGRFSVLSRTDDPKSPTLQ